MSKPALLTPVRNGKSQALHNLLTPAGEYSSFNSSKLFRLIRDDSIVTRWSICSLCGSVVFFGPWGWKL